ncbi:HD domain-containing protein [Lichenihabitans sp. Uapishka_5]|uniref:HD-GYP domain-containing protein n=1 Tax=Lichenihabitans sp. Uapishka_5 TaxID=3037302 RepID=UPI0029E8119C|nr:HD domain-containing phosphohydrolase [Lichenihabitans sp. Uapishka_5]MDX7950188.1 HD domain-containing protein [Lichenihabitans sp. Uapishka_5]
MFLLTDRLGEARRLQRILAEVAPCTVLPLALSEIPRVEPRLVICDVAFDSTASVEATRLALARLALTVDVPVLGLLRDPSHLTQAQATMAGATTTMPVQVDPATLIRAVRALMPTRPQMAVGPRPVGEAAASVCLIETVLGAVIGKRAERQVIAPAMVEEAGGILLTAIEQVRIKAWLDVVWTHDDVTYQHCLLVAGLVAAFAIELGLPPKAQHLLSQAALVHDIGKSRIPRTVLNKTTPLTLAEMALVRSHAALGHALLESQQGYHPAILDIVRHHHEFLDGSGYPDRQAGTQVSRFVRMVTICDIYAALIERRPYKAAVSTRAATAYLTSLGPKLDGALVDAFRNVVREI